MPNAVPGSSRLRREIVKLAREDRGFARLLVAEFHRLADLKRRQITKLVQGPRSFMSISAWKGDRSRSENKAAMARLRRDLEKQGLHPIDSWATWKDAETGKLYGEDSFIVPGVTAPQAFEIGREFEQDSVIYRSPKGVLAMYDTRGAEPKAYVAHRADGSPAYRVQTEKSPKREKGKGPRGREREQEELFSRTRGVNFEFDFLWDHPVRFDGETPVTPKRMREVVGRAFRSEGAGIKARWEEYLKREWEGGKKMVRNTNPKSRDAHPRVTMLTLMRTDPKFRDDVIARFRRERRED